MLMEERGLPRAEARVPGSEAGVRCPDVGVLRAEGRRRRADVGVLRDRRGALRADARVRAEDAPFLPSDLGVLVPETAFRGWVRPFLAWTMGLAPGRPRSASSDPGREAMSAAVPSTRICRHAGAAEAVRPDERGTYDFL